MKTGVLLMNTGSPDAPAEQAVRRYLREFLMDPNVIDFPWPLRALLVYGIILPRRPAKSAEAYQAVWTENGSPLIYHCTELARALQQQAGLPVEAGMAYGNPSIQAAIQKLVAVGVEKIRVLPLFPQYAMATVGTCVAKAQSVSPVPLEVIAPFYNHPAFIQPLADSLAGLEEYLLFSYHGLPERHLRKTDPTGSHCLATAHCCETASPAHSTCYRHQCFETTKAIVKAAGIPADRYSIAFQSRLGRDKWMEPYTDEMLKQLPVQGIKNLAVICPAFFCDCLETLEEIGLRGRETFLGSGGETFRLIPCLNAGESAVQCLAQFVSNAR